MQKEKKNKYIDTLCDFILAIWIIIKYYCMGLAAENWCF